MSLRAPHFAAAALLLLAAPAATAKTPPQGVRAYSACVLENVRLPGAEAGGGYDPALDMAKSLCGNLRPAAIAAVHKAFKARLAGGGDDPQLAAQAFLDIFVDEQAAAIWAEQHPQDDSHAR